MKTDRKYFTISELQWAIHIMNEKVKDFSRHTLEDICSTLYSEFNISNDMKDIQIALNYINNESGEDFETESRKLEYGFYDLSQIITEKDGHVEKF